MNTGTTHAWYMILSSTEDPAETPMWEDSGKSKSWLPLADSSVTQTQTATGNQTTGPPGRVGNQKHPFALSIWSDLF